MEERKKEELTDKEIEGVSGGSKAPKEQYKLVQIPTKILGDMSSPKKTAQDMSYKKCKHEGCSRPAFADGKDPDYCFLHQPIISKL